MPIRENYSIKYRLRQLLKLDDSQKDFIKRSLYYLLGAIGLMLYATLLLLFDLPAEGYMLGIGIGLGVCVVLVILDVFFIIKNANKNSKK